MLVHWPNSSICWYSELNVNLNNRSENYMDDSKGLSYFMLGLGIGVAVGIVFAPQSGEDTRGLLRSKALEGGDYVKRQSEALKGSAEELVEKGKTAIKTQKEQLAAAVDAGKQAYRESVASAGDAKGSEAI